MPDEANLVFLNRDSGKGQDDASELNALIAQWRSSFSFEFLQTWNAAYQRYCQQRTDITLVQGAES